MNLPMEEIGKFKEMFHTMDKNKDGSLSLEELKEGFRINDHPVPEEEIKMLLQAVSASGILILYKCSTRMSSILASELQ
jgi:calcium-dependent protein kinase